ncbi:polysaccharide pyruvyl transferase family protein [Cohnella sp.]|uniref:polysaccharide pyruvyl transferase family protein n=1 Tax=Cohnella sp. TaxID=1883426 RepID=UPI00356B07F7
MSTNGLYQLLGTKKIIIFGTGEAAEKFIYETKIHVEMFLDNNSRKWDDTFLGGKVCNPDKILSYHQGEYVVIIASMYYMQIAEQLNHYGLKEDVDYFDSQLLLIYHSTDHVSGDDRIKYPRTINYPITNKCNYRCAMCNVWKPEYSAHKDLSPQEIYKVFKQPLFQKLEFVGISGGEPFVRKDIVEVVENMVDALPNLRGLSIISNASLDSMQNKIQLIREVLTSRNIAFTLQISIDGLNEYHDLNRGVKGAFERTIRNFYQLNNEGLVSEISTTITKKNYSKLWGIYKFAKDNNVYIRFRLASLIERLYNQDLSENYTFNKKERLTIIKFLENIIHYHEKNLEKKIFYKSLIGQLQGEKRKSGCYWKTSEGVSLDPYGNLFFCFPKSPKITKLDLEKEYDIELLQENKNLLEQTLRHCDKCIHDYRGKVTTEGAQLLYGPVRKNRENYAVNSRLIEQYRNIIVDKVDIKSTVLKKVSIIGWYGTETLGDKAILAGIIINLQEYGIALEDITLVSLHPTLSELTLLELELDTVKVVDTYEVKENIAFISSQDLFLFGGGPLCDVEPLLDMMTIFIRAKEQGKRTVIYGSGIGPLNNERYREGLDILLNYTDKISLRDKKSLVKYRDILPAMGRFKDINHFIDPASRYIQQFLGEPEESIIADEYVIFSFRKWPIMYAEGLEVEQYKQKEALYEEHMIRLINDTISQGHKVVLFPMHTYHVGDDDREYYAHIMQNIYSKDKVLLITDDLTPRESINYFRFAKFAVCLRFHSVVFAVTCNTPCLAIDYHYGKGKVSGFMEAVGLQSWVYDIDQLIATESDTIINLLESPNVEWDEVNRFISNKNNELSDYMQVITK